MGKIQQEYIYKFCYPKNLTCLKGWTEKRGDCLIYTSEFEIPNFIFVFYLKDSLEREGYLEILSSYTMSERSDEPQLIESNFLQSEGKILIEKDKFISCCVEYPASLFVAYRL